MARERDGEREREGERERDGERERERERADASTLLPRHIESSTLRERATERELRV